nr:MAG TPA: hypothetical protein [Caudoviricetes sp.]
MWSSVTVEISLSMMIEFENLLLPLHTEFRENGVLAIET